MNKYEIILDVCETHSISKTAEKLNYTQSAISQAIRSYEKELGFPLFKRSKSGMDLLLGTEEIIESLRIICREEQQINRLAARLNGLDTGYIRIGTIQSIAYHWLPDILKEFSSVYPNINFELTVDGFRGLKEKLHSGEMDCIFVSRYSVPEASFIPFGTDELMFVAPADHPLASKAEVSLDDINNENFILSSDGLDYEMGNIFAMNNITPRIRYRLNEDFATLKMVEAGFGITVLPRLLLADAPFDVCVRSFSSHYTRVLGVAYSENEAAAPATLRFLDFVREANTNQANPI